MESKERLLNSQTIYQGRVLNVRKDELQTPSGSRVVREIVDHPGAIAVVPIFDDRTVVMVKQYRHATGKVLLEIPAGTLKQGEKPLQCAKRELVEETGYRAGRFRKLLQCYLAPGYSSELIHIYLATDLSRVERRPEEDEFIDVLRVEIHRILAMIKRKEIEDAKTICGILLFILNNR